MIAALKRGSHRTWQSPQGRSKTCDGVEVMKLGMKPAKLDVSLSHDNDVCVCIYIYIYIYIHNTYTPGSRLKRDDFAHTLENSRLYIWLSETSMNGETMSQVTIDDSKAFFEVHILNFRVGLGAAPAKFILLHPEEAP